MTTYYRVVLERVDESNPDTAANTTTLAELAGSAEFVASGVGSLARELQRDANPAGDAVRLQPIAASIAAPDKPRRGRPPKDRTAEQAPAVSPAAEPAAAPATDEDPFK